MPVWRYEVAAFTKATDLEKRLNDLSGRGYVLQSLVPRSDSVWMVAKVAQPHAGDYSPDPLDWLRDVEDEHVPTQPDAVVVPMRPVT